MNPRAVFRWLSLVIVLAVLATFAVLFIPPLFKAPEKTPEAAVERPDGPVLIFVHGAASNPKRFDWLAARLAEAGWTAQRRFAYDCRNEWIEEIAARLEDFVDHEAGQRRIVIIAHSMGGIVSRYYVERLGGSVRTDALVLLGTPNRGTQSADAMRMIFKPDYLDSARIGGKPLDPAERILLRTMISSLKLEYGTESSLQLTTDSPLIRELNSRPLPEGVRYLVVAGTSSAGGILGHYQLLNDLRARLGLPMPNPNDGIVPLACATIPPELGKTELLTVDASHVELTFDKKVLERILALLDQITSAALPPEPQP